MKLLMVALLILSSTFATQVMALECKDVFSDRTVVAQPNLNQQGIVINFPRFSNDPVPFPSDGVLSSSNDNYYLGGAYSNRSVEISGPDDVVVYVRGDLTFGEAVKINQNGSPSRLLIIVDGDFTTTANSNNEAARLEINAHIFATGNVTIANNDFIDGAIAAGGTILLGNRPITPSPVPLSDSLKEALCIDPEDEEAGIDHFRILHDSDALTCQASVVEVRACANLDCSTLYVDPVSISLLPESGWVGGRNQTLTDGSGNLALRSNVPDLVTLDVASSSVSVFGNPSVRCFADGGTSESNCRILFSESGFLLDVPNHISGQTVQATMLAVKAGDTDPGQCVPAFTGSKSVRFTAEYQNPAFGTLPVESAGIALSGNLLTLDFDSVGATSFPVRYRDVGDVTLRARFDGSGEESGLAILGQDRFIARPDRFEVSIPGNPESPDVTGASVFRTAGDVFGVEVLALNALGERTPNFGREQPAEGVTLTVEQAAGFSLPNLAGLDGELGLFGESCAEPLGGKACGEFSWPEVGTFALRPFLSSGAYLGSENVGGPVVPYVGRFIPAWFEMAIDPGRFSSEPLSSDRTSCSGERSWVYTGEPFGWAMPPELILAPKNLNGVTTQNYAGTAFQRLAIDDLVFAEFPAEDESATGVDGSPLEAEAIFAPAILTPAAGGDLIYRFGSDDEFRYSKTRNARIDAYGPQLAFRLDGLADADGVTVLNPAEDLPAAFTPEAEFAIRYGRIALDNAFGPENLDLVIPLRAEVYANGGFRMHPEENCWFYDLPDNTAVDFSESAFASGQTGVVGVAETELILEDGRPLFSGAVDYRLKLSAPNPPGTESPNARGIRVELDTGNDWLKDFWDADNPEALVNPYAWATFGVYRGNDRIIYWREVPVN